MGFSARDLTWFSAVVRRLHACLDERDLFATLVPLLHARFQATITSAEEVAYDRSRHVMHGLAGEWRPPPYYLAAIVDSPLAVRITETRASATFHTAEMVPRSEVERTHAHNLLFRPAGLRDQIMGIFPTSPRTTCVVGLSRDADFHTDDRLIFSEVKRHVAAALCRVRPAEPRVAGELGDEPVLPLGSDLRPEAINPRLRSLLASYFPLQRHRLAAGQLPDELAAWVRASIAMLQRRPPPHPLTCWRTEAARGSLVIRVFLGHDGGGVLLRFYEGLRVPDPMALAAGAGLTTRECEVLFWIGEGKRDAEIAIILGAAPRTVGKHIERILAKLGVPSRVAAARVTRGLRASA